MNLGSLLDFMGTLLDYDPSNSTYRAQVVTLLNDAQVRCLTDRHWDFSTRDRKVQVWTDTTLTLNVTSGTATATGTGFPVSTDLVKPGSELARAEVTFTDSAGNSHKHRIAWVENGTTLYLDRIYRGTSGAVSALVKRRDVFLPSDSMNVLNVADPSVGVPAKALMLSKWEREDANLDADLLGTVEAYVPSEGVLVRAPQMVRGVTVVGASAGQGARTVDVYMVNVSGPNSQNYPAYRSDVSSGFESAFSKVSSFTLSDTQTLNFTPETIPNHTGLYRRYYFTCSEAGIIAPVRVRNADAEGGAIIDRDTINTKGGITLKPDLALGILQGQAFHSTSIRYRFNQSSAYRSIQLYPHPAENQKLDVRVSINPARMQEDQDATLIPASYSKMLAYSALEKLALKVDGASALAVAYSRERAVLYKGMEARFLAQVPRRIIKGSPTAGYRFVRNPYGKLTFS